MRSATRRCSESQRALPEPKGAQNASLRQADRSSAPMSVVQVTDQTRCGRAGMQRGRSDTCALCSGGGEDRGDMPRSSTGARALERCSPQASQLERAGHREEESAVRGCCRPKLSAGPPEEAAPAPAQPTAAERPVRDRIQRPADASDGASSPMKTQTQPTRRFPRSGRSAGLTRRELEGLARSVSGAELELKQLGNRGSERSTLEEGTVSSSQRSNRNR